MAEPEDYKDKIYRIVVRRLPRQERVWEISTRFRFTDCYEVYDRKSDLGEAGYDYQNDMPFDRQANQLAEILYKIHGIQRVVIDQYDVDITIGRAFDDKDKIVEQAINTIKIYIRSKISSPYDKSQ